MSERVPTPFANCKSYLREKGDLTIKQGPWIGEAGLTHTETNDRLLQKILSGITSHLILVALPGRQRSLVTGTRVTGH